MAGKIASPAAIKGVEAFKERFDKAYGEGSLRTGKEALAPYQVIPTGSLVLDYALGTGGLVEGRLSEWYGWDDVGKTTMALIAVAEAQRKYPDRMVAYIDMENKLDLDWAVAHGVNLSRFWPYWPKTAEDVADATTDFVKEHFVSMLVVDSIGAMISRVEMEKQADEATVAVVARIVTRMVKAATSQARQHKPVVILINQLRSEIRAAGRGGNGTTRPGGNALRFQTTTRLKLSYTDEPAMKAQSHGDSIEVAREIGIQVERNKCALKGRVAKIKLVSVPTEIHGPLGIDVYDETARLADTLGLLSKAGSWYSVGSEKLQGLKAVAAYLKEHPDEATALRAQILSTRAGEVTDDLGVPLAFEGELEAVEGPSATTGEIDGDAFLGSKFRRSAL
jgi:recombination protein RecA